MEAYQVGCRDFAESRVNDALKKMETLPADIRWHFIGKLQKNKVSKAIGRFCLIHSVDSRELAEKISVASLNQNLVTKILLQVNTSKEESKSGLSSEEWKQHLDYLFTLQGVEIQGLMTIAPLTMNEWRIRQTFSYLRLLRDEIGRDLPILSMGMSHDFHIAIQEGSTLVRIGSKIFISQ
jgi:PLP dependent protein